MRGSRKTKKARGRKSKQLTRNKEAAKKREIKHRKETETLSRR
jgi:hypothetical protein